MRQGGGFGVGRYAPLTCDCLSYVFVLVEVGGVGGGEWVGGEVGGCGDASPA